MDRLDVAETAPQVRARYMQTMVRAFEVATHGLHPIESICAPDIVRRIEAAGALAWLPLEVNQAVVKAIHGVLGDPRTRSFFRGLLLEVFASSMFRRFVEGLLHAFEPTPANALRWLPQGWAVLFRNCGDWTLDIGERRATVELSGLPPGCFDPSWLEAMVGGLASLIEVVRHDGDVRLIAHDEARGAMHLEVEWEESRRPRP